jgi:organic hydroperoxide reductase OsmC/OhrA
MAAYTATVTWRRTDPDFAPDTYRRDHAVRFGSGQAISGSAAPEYRGNPELMNPEEALVGALSSCHMLTFLAIAARKGLVVDAYDDDASGTLGPNEDRKLAMTEVTLRPRVVFSGREPSREELGKLHESAHRACFIANSVRTRITIEPQ